jgi:hypothetical protein
MDEGHTPGVYFGIECSGRQGSARTKELLQRGTRVHLFSEPATDRVDDFGRLLRYVVRVSDGLIMNLRLVPSARRHRTSTAADGDVTPRVSNSWPHAHASKARTLESLSAHGVRPVLRHPNPR